MDVDEDEEKEPARSAHVSYGAPPAAPTPARTRLERDPSTGARVLVLPNTLADTYTPNRILVSGWLRELGEQEAYDNCAFVSRPPDSPPALVFMNGGGPGKHTGIAVAMDKATLTFVRSRPIAYTSASRRDADTGLFRYYITELRIDLDAKPPAGAEPVIAFGWAEFLRRYLAQSRKHLMHAHADVTRAGAAPPPQGD